MVKSLKGKINKNFKNGEKYSVNKETEAIREYLESMMCLIKLKCENPNWWIVEVNLEGKSGAKSESGVWQRRLILV